RRTADGLEHRRSEAAVAGRPHSPREEGKMSVSIGRRRRNLGAAAHEPPLAKVFLWTVSFLTALAAAPGALRLAGNHSHLIQLVIWAATVAAVDLVPIRVWGSVSVSMSFPVTLAAGMIFLPTE